jgi:hypothetical protein
MLFVKYISYESVQEPVIEYLSTEMHYGHIPDTGTCRACVCPDRPAGSAEENRPLRGSAGGTPKSFLFNIYPRLGIKDPQIVFSNFDLMYKVEPTPPSAGRIQNNFIYNFSKILKFNL